MIIEGIGTDGTGEIRINGTVLSPARSQAVWNHSPDGFAWSYAGSGPSQLALAILLEAGLSEAQAVALHQRFKAAHLVLLPPGPFTLELDLDAWVAQQLPTVAVSSPDEDDPPRTYERPTRGDSPRGVKRTIGNDD